MFIKFAILKLEGLIIHIGHSYKNIRLALALEQFNLYWKDLHCVRNI